MPSYLLKFCKTICKATINAIKNFVKSGEDDYLYYPKKND